MRSIRIPCCGNHRYYLSPREQELYETFRHNCDPIIVKQYVDALRGRAYLNVLEALARGDPVRLRIAHGLADEPELLALMSDGTTSEVHATTT